MDRERTARELAEGGGVIGVVAGFRSALGDAAGGGRRSEWIEELRSLDFLILPNMRYVILRQ